MFFFGKRKPKLLAKSDPNCGCQRCLKEGAKKVLEKPMSADLAYTLWLAALAAYNSRLQNLVVHWEIEAFENRLERWRKTGV